MFKKKKKRFPASLSMTSLSTYPLDRLAWSSAHLEYTQKHPITVFIHFYSCFWIIIWTVVKTDACVENYVFLPAPYMPGCMGPTPPRPLILWFNMATVSISYTQSVTVCEVTVRALYGSKSLVQQHKELNQQQSLS